VSTSCDALRDAKILVVSDVPSDAEMVCAMLCAEFSNVAVASVSEPVANDFDRYQPEVLVLAFSTLEKTQTFDRELFRLSKLATGLQHRTVILCSQNEAAAAFALCRQERFHDYVLFWPMAHDALRLPMAVTNALRNRQHSHGAVTAAQTDELATRESAHLKHEFDLSTSPGKHPGLHALHQQIQPLFQWVENMQGQRAVRLAVAESEQAAHLQPLVLVVDDCEFDRKLMEKLLETTFYELVFAASGAEALGILSKKRPDLILMDLDMPVLSGLDTLRKLKAVPRLTDIPVMMVTGQSGKDVVVDCLRAGAVGFVVKPLQREAFLKKLDKFFDSAAPQYIS
jgi:CheY-like chemotaxis protein